MRGWVLTLSVLLAAAPARAAGGGAVEARVRGFPPANELFERLLADPRQAQTSARYYRALGLDAADVALGNTWGLRRWRTASGTAVQADLEGMAYSVFKLSGSVNEFETVDFFANLPVEARAGRWSARATLFHESSHLGDDYIRRTGSDGTRYSIEGLRAVVSYDAASWARLYGGASYLLHRIPAVGRRGVQAGFELTTGDLRRAPPRCRLYFAEDLQSKEAVGWNLNSNAEIGVRLSDDGSRRSVRVHLDRFDGHAEFGQFYRMPLSTNSVGVSFDF